MNKPITTLFILFSIFSHSKNVSSNQDCNIGLLDCVLTGIENISSLEERIESLEKKLIITNKLLDSLTIIADAQSETLSMLSSVYDSEYFLLTKGAKVTKTHNLKRIPTNAIVWYSVHPDGREAALAVGGVYNRGNTLSHGTWLQKVTASEYTISSGNGGAHGHYGTPRHTSFGVGKTSYSKVYVRVLLY